MRRILVKPVLIFMLAGSLAVMGQMGAGAASTSRYTVAFINGDNIDPFFLTIWRGAAAQAQKYGMAFIEQAPSKYDYTQQVPLLNDMIARKVSAILLSADSDDALEPQLKTAFNAGIPVVLVNNVKVTKPRYVPFVLSFIGTDPELLGHTAGEALSKLIGGRGTVGVINSVPGLRGSMLRGNGAIDVLSKFPDVKVLPMQFSRNSPSKAYQIATDLMQAHPDLAGLYATDAFTGQGMASAIKALHKQGKVKAVAIDAEPQEVEALKAGALQTLIAQQPYKMGTLGIDYLYYALTGHKDKIVESVLVPPIPVTPQNVSTPEVQKSVVYSPKGPTP